MTLAAATAPETESHEPIAFGWRKTFITELTLRHAGPTRVRLEAEWQGPLTAPVVAVLGGISAHRHVAASFAFPEPGWWPEQVGPGLALDTHRYRILSINWVGSDGSHDVALDSSDQADALAAVLDNLKIERLEALVGCSYGAMVGLQFAARYPTRLERLVAISGADRSHPYSSAWRALQRRVVRLGRGQGQNKEALSVARQLARLSYGTPEEFAENFPGPTVVVDGRVRCASEDFLDQYGASYVSRTPLTAFVRLSESIDLHLVEPESVTVPTVLVAVEEDRLVPPDTLIALGQRLPALEELHLLTSAFGHDAFLKEPREIAAILRSSLVSPLELPA